MKPKLKQPTEEERIRVRCRSCVFNGYAKCGRMFCALPRCVNGAVRRLTDGKAKN